MSEDLLRRFNERDCEAFGQVYLKVYDELSFFARRLYAGSEIESSDALHDAFLSVWQQRRLKFERIETVKSYFYRTLKNNYLNYLAHNRHVKQYSDICRKKQDFAVEIIESKVYSLVSRSIEILPEECAQIMRYHLEGWNAKEIAQQLNISERTVFNRQAKALAILEKKLPRKIFVGLFL